MDLFWLKLILLVIINLKDVLLMRFIFVIISLGVGFVREFFVYCLFVILIFVNFVLICFCYLFFVCSFDVKDLVIVMLFLIYIGLIDCDVDICILDGGV